MDNYAFKNEISLSIGDESSMSSASTPSTVTPAGLPTPTPRSNFENDTKPLTKKGDEKPNGIDNQAFSAEESPPLKTFGNGHTNGLNDTHLGANGASKNGQVNEKKLAGEFCSFPRWLHFEDDDNFFASLLTFSLRILQKLLT